MSGGFVTQTDSDADMVLMFFNSLSPRKNCGHFADDFFRCIFLNRSVWISLKISLKLVPEFRNNNIAALVQIMDWRLPGDKPLSEPMMIISLTPIRVTRPQWLMSFLQNSICPLTDAMSFWRNYIAHLLAKTRIYSFNFFPKILFAGANLKKLMDIQSRFRWFETTCWRSCDVIVISWITRKDKYKLVCGNRYLRFNADLSFLTLLK